MTASGGMPGELIGGWRGTGESTMDVEYGFSCMGYELAGAWGAAMARKQGVVTTLLGDGSYLMLNSEIFSAAFAGHGFVAVVCDNDGYAVIARLQEGQGGAPFNNMYPDCRSTADGRARTDFAAHAASLGAAVFPVEGGSASSAEAYRAARKAAADRPAVVVVRTHPSSWTESGPGGRLARRAKIPMPKRPTRSGTCISRPNEDRPHATEQHPDQRRQFRSSVRRWPGSSPRVAVTWRSARAAPTTRTAAATS